MIVEDGTGLDSADSFVSVEFADIYFATRNRQDWTGSTSIKESSLIIASEYISNMYVFKGSKLNYSQGLAFPRVIYDVEEFPNNILKATCEIAIMVLLGEDIYKENVQTLKRKKTGDLEKEYFESSSERSTFKKIDKMLYPFTISPIVGIVNW